MKCKENKDELYFFRILVKNVGCAYYWYMNAHTLQVSVSLTCLVLLLRVLTCGNPFLSPQITVKYSETITCFTIRHADLPYVIGSYHYLQLTGFNPSLKDWCWAYLMCFFSVIVTSIWTGYFCSEITPNYPSSVPSNLSLFSDGGKF